VQRDEVGMTNRRDATRRGAAAPAHRPLVPSDSLQRRSLRVLAAAQVLGGLGVGANVAASGLIAAQVAGSEAVAGLASTAAVLGAGLAAVPLAGLTSERGRRHGLAAGLVTGALGAVLVVLGATLGVLALALVGILLTGSATASGLQARYAATDLAAPGHAAGAMSVVVWATTVGAVLGPNLSGVGAQLGERLGIMALAGTYVISAVAFLAAAGVVWALLRPDPLLVARSRDPELGSAVHGPRLRERTTRAWTVVRGTPDALLGLAAVALGHAAMVAVMVMTPVHMAHADVSITVIGVVISVHILGMYALSPVVGWAADRVGRHAVLVAGAVLLLAAAAIAGLAPADHHVAVGGGLFLLGLGWSCCLVAGSTLLSESVPVASRQDSQGLSDLTMNVAAAIAGAAAGGVVAVLSYGWLAALAGAIVLPLAAGAWRTRGVAAR
jgi:MFS family permease